METVITIYLIIGLVFGTFVIFKNMGSVPPAEGLSERGNKIAAGIAIFIALVGITVLWLPLLIKALYGDE